MHGIFFNLKNLEVQFFFIQKFKKQFNFENSVIRKSGHRPFQNGKGTWNNQGLLTTT